MARQRSGTSAYAVLRGAVVGWGVALLSLLPSAIGTGDAGDGVPRAALAAAVTGLVLQTAGFLRRRREAPSGDGRHVARDPGPGAVRGAAIDLLLDAASIALFAFATLRGLAATVSAI